jgi:outer membrane lipoprotein-sorting protein
MKRGLYRATTNPRQRRSRLAASFALVFCLACWAVRAQDTNSLLSAWITRQAEVSTWSADFTQTRALKSLAQPLTATGHVWFAEPNRFRWELGKPPQNVVIRGANKMTVVYPQLKRAERYSLDQPGPWRDTLALLDAGFPQSEVEMRTRFDVKKMTMADGVAEFAFVPTSAGARRMMPQMKIAFATNDFTLRATELTFADGSRMRNQFTNAEVNVTIEESQFSDAVPADFKITEPLKDR